MTSGPIACRRAIALIVTPEGFPLAYEVLAGNTSDKTTLEAFLQKIEAQYGKAERIWVMDRGIPTEAVLAQMRASDPPIYYLVGTPKARLRRRLRDLAPGLTPRAVLEKFAALQMIDVHLPTSDGRTLTLSRYTQPETELQLLLRQLKLRLPTQPPPRITAAGHLAEWGPVVKTFGAPPLMLSHLQMVHPSNPRNRVKVRVACPAETGEGRLRNSCTG